MERFEVKFDWPYTRIGSWTNGNPYTIAFCYPIESKPYVLKGGCNNINKYLDSLKEPTLVNKTFWHQGKTRYASYRFFGIKNVYVDESYVKEHSRKRNGWSIGIYEKKGKIEICHLRRVPKAFPRELKRYIEKAKRLRDETIVGRLLDSIS
jgi:hypothetical protein